VQKKLNANERTLRIADQIQRDLSEMIRHEVSHPQINWVTLQSVELTADHAHAKIYFTMLIGEPEQMQQVLNEAAGRLRSLLFKRLHIRVVPILHFVFDTTLEKAAEMSRLIDQANATRAED